MAEGPKNLSNALLRWRWMVEDSLPKVEVGGSHEAVEFAIFVQLHGCTVELVEKIGVVNVDFTRIDAHHRT